MLVGYFVAELRLYPVYHLLVLARCRSVIQVRPDSKANTYDDNYINFEHSYYYITILSVTFELCVMYRPPPPKRTGFSNTVFLHQWSAILNDILLDMHDFILTGDLYFHLNIPTQLGLQRFS